VARAAVPGRLAGRLSWQSARLVEHRDETPTARTLVLEVLDWPGHLAGQHVDIRLTADDGYQAVRSYSLAAASDHHRIEVTVQRVPDGEVSPYLVDVFSLGDTVEVRGPLGGWFVWRPTERAPVLLVAGGAGIVPLMAMVRARSAAGSRVPFRLTYSVRTPQEGYYEEELHRLQHGETGVDVTYIFTRSTPKGFARPPGRIGIRDLETPNRSPDGQPICFVCGPTGFVELVAGTLVTMGYDPGRVKTERFGPSGG